MSYQRTMCFVDHHQMHSGWLLRELRVYFTNSTFISLMQWLPTWLVTWIDETAPPPQPHGAPSNYHPPSHRGVVQRRRRRHKGAHFQPASQSVQYNWEQQATRCCCSFWITDVETFCVISIMVGDSPSTPATPLGSDTYNVQLETWELEDGLGCGWVLWHMTAAAAPQIVLLFWKCGNLFSRKDTSKFKRDLRSLWVILDILMTI